MPILAMSAGTVTALWGNAFIRQADGSLKPVKVGDKVAGGEHILTDAAGLVQISPTKGHAAQLLKAQAQPEAAPSVDKTIAGVDAQDPQDAPAAGLIGGADGGMQPGLRVERVSETIAPSALSLSGADANSQAATAQTGSSADQRALPSEAPAQASINDIVVNEGSGTATFTVTLDKAATGTVTIPFSTKADTAVDGGDFTSKSGSLSFAPGETSKTVTVVIHNDAIYEGEERFSVQLGTPVNAALGKGEGVALIHDDGTGTVAPDGIRDDDRPHVASVSGAHTAEGGELAFHFKLTSDSTTDTQVFLKLTGEAGLSLGDDLGDVRIYQGPGTDGLALHYEAASDGRLVLTVPALTPADTEYIVRIDTRNDFKVEGTEQLQLAVSTVHDTAAHVATGVIDDVAPVIPYSISGEPTVEGGHVGFNLVMTDPSPTAVAVHLALTSGDDDPYTLINESAKLGLDTGTTLQWESAPGVWQDVNGALAFQPGDTQIHLRLSTVGDQLPEATEYIKLLATFDDPRFDQPITVVNQTAIDDDKDAWYDPINPASTPLPETGPDGAMSLQATSGSSEVFAWHLGDHRVDTIEGFDARATGSSGVGGAGEGGDVLDLRDLLQGEEMAGASLDHYLHVDSSTSSTVIKIAASGDMADGHSASNVDSLHIVLDNVNLPSVLGLAANATDAQIIAKLVQQGNLLVDHA